MRTQLRRVLVAAVLLAGFALPAAAQRRSRPVDRNDSQVRLDIRLFNGRPELRFIKYDRTYYGPTGRYRVSLRRLARVSRPAFQRALRDHRELHRVMRHLPRQSARRMHAEWHRQTGWSHREFVEIERR